MPIIIGLTALSAVVALTVKSMTDDVDRVAGDTGRDLIVLGVAGLGLWATFKMLRG